MQIENSEHLTEEIFNELTERLQELNPRVQVLAAKADDIIALIGATGVGKSTLACYLKNIKPYFNKQGGGEYIIKYDDKIKGLPQIGHGTSCTTIPGVYQEKQNVYVDLAGWYDTRSCKQEIVNSISNSQIFNRGKKVKILMVVQVQELSASRGGCLVQNSNRLLQFFLGDFNKMINSIVLVISKVNITEWSIEDIEKKILKIFQNTQHLGQNTKFLLKSLVHQKRIVIFPRPDQITDHIKVIEEKIKNISPTSLSQNGNITMSQKARNMVHECVNFLNRDLHQLGKAIASDIQKNFKIESFSFNTGGQVNNVLKELKTAEIILQKEFETFQSSQKKTKLLYEFGQKVHVSKQVCDKMNKTFTMIYFYSSLSRSIKLDFRFISFISAKINEMRLNLEVIRNDLLSKEEIKKMEEEFDKILTLREEQNKEFLKKIEQQRESFENDLQKQLTAQQETYNKQMENRKTQLAEMERQLRKVRLQSQTQINRIRSQVSQSRQVSESHHYNDGNRRSKQCNLI